MEKCSICGQTSPFPRLTLDKLHAKKNTELSRDLHYWRRELAAAIPYARHWNKLRRRADTRVEAYEEEIHRRKVDAMRQDSKRVKTKKAA